MVTRILEELFTHNDDCRMSGCPSHSMKIEHQTTSDSINVYIDKKLVFSEDIQAVKTLIDILQKLDL